MKNIKYIILFALLLGGGVNVVAQSGFLGSTNAVEFKTYIGPSYRKVLKLKSDNTIQTNRLRLAYMSYELNYTRTMTRHIELSLGYKYANMRAFTDGARIQMISTSEFDPTLIERSFLTAPQIQSHGVAFQFKYFRKGSLAPIGKYVGVNLTYQTAAFKSGDELYSGSLGGSNGSSSFFGASREVTNIDTLSLKRTQRVNSYHFKGIIGRNYPITNKVLLTIAASVPIISYYSGGVFGFIGPQVRSGGNVKDTDSDGLTSITLKKYNRMSIEVGVRYQL